MDVILKICCWWTNQINLTCFTVNKFEDGMIHFLDISLTRTSFDIYRNHTNTGQNVLFSSHERGLRKIAWVRALLHQASRICEIDSLFQEQRTMIKTFLLGNGFPKSVASNLVRCFRHSSSEPRTSYPNNNKTMSFKDFKF